MFGFLYGYIYSAPSEAWVRGKIRHRRSETLQRDPGSNQSPPAKLASSRNRVLRGAGATQAAKRRQGAGRPRDGAPKSSKCGSRRRFIDGRQHLRAAMAWFKGSAGVEERGMSAWGFPRNLGDPVLSADRSAVGEAATRNNPGPVARGIDPTGSEQRMHGRYHGDMPRNPGRRGMGSRSAS